MSYRASYAKYYESLATADSPKLRDSNPSVVIIPGIGLFGFGKNKKEARITTEFFINAVNVMAGANALEEIKRAPPTHCLRRSARTIEAVRAVPQLRRAASVGAFRIEYWALEEAKLQRMPAEAEFSRKIVVIVGGGSGIGREVALLLARKGAHLVVADADAESAATVAADAGKRLARRGRQRWRSISARRQPRECRHVRDTAFGGIDAIVNTAAIYPVPGADGRLTDASGARHSW